MKPTIIFGLIKETFKQWHEDKASRLSAALAYYTIFSLPPLLIIVIAITSFFLGEDAARGQIVNQFQGLIGSDGAKLIEVVIAGATKPDAISGLSASIISIVVLIFGATAVVIELQDALNTIWDVSSKPGNNIKAFLFNRLLSFGMLMGIAFMLLVSLVISAALAILSNYLGSFLQALKFIWPLIDIVISMSVVTILFALIFKYLPDVKIAWNDVMIGAVLTALLFTIGKYLIGLYLAKSTFSSTYGATGSLIVLLAWIYYSVQILFLGAEFTQVYARHHGSLNEPTENAEYITDKMRVQQDLSNPKH